MKSVLFVCHANLVRSPALQACLEHRLSERGIKNAWVESCGIHPTSLNTQADYKMRAKAKEYGITIDHLSLLFIDPFFEQFDYIFAVTEDIRLSLLQRAPKKHRDKILLATEYCHNYNDQDIPDPYSCEGGFEYTFSVIQSSVDGIVEALFTK